MGHFQAGYGIGDGGGAELFLPGAELGDAVREAERVYGRDEAVFYDGDLYSTGLAELGEFDELQPNRSAGGMAAAAHRACGLETYRWDEVMALSLERAHRKLKRFFVHYGTGRRRGAPIARYQSPSGMRSAFLTKNAKTSKGAQKRIAGVSPALSRGVNLLPHRLAAELSRKQLPLTGMGLCVGSSTACRSTCLLYSGLNPIADSQVPIKLARTEALLKEPVAWLRMLVAAVQWHVDWCARRSLEPYLRPNLLSDIPWERVCPELVAHLQQVRWYDYTKVSGREYDPERYDMTFSFNGQNERACVRELSRGIRCAVVFWLPHPCTRHRQPCDSVTELSFLGQPVLDGDLHDLRPLDPQGSVIGLSYKPVTLTPGKRAVTPPPAASKFVVPAFRDPDSGALLVAGTPAQLGSALAFERQGPTALTVS
ncbi:MAG: hypothetical protein JRD89_10760 [Deltaproteobacteria bacterium]|nr:hypothetical protein [Deltaproteobacteria bacterium]